MKTKSKQIYGIIFLVLVANLFLVFAVNLDLNGDGTVNITDLDNLASKYRGKAAYNASYDLNGDSSVNLFDVVSIAKNISTIPTPEFEEDWDYADTSDLITGNPNGWFNYDYDIIYGGGAINLDTNVTDAPWGGTKAFKINFSAGSCGDEVGAGTNIVFPTENIPANTRELWYEIYTKFESHWKTNFSCSGNPDHKWVFYSQDFWGGQGRFSDKIGTYGYAMTAGVNNGTVYAGGGDGSKLEDYVARNPPENGTLLNTSTFWDGEWHLVQVHLKAPDPDTSNGIFELDFDGTRYVDRHNFTITITSSGGFTGLNLGRNVNHHPDQDQAFWFGRIRVWNEDPGWS